MNRLKQLLESNYVAMAHMGSHIPWKTKQENIKNRFIPSDSDDSETDDENDNANNLELPNSRQSELEDILNRLRELILNNEENEEFSDSEFEATGDNQEDPNLTTDNLEDGDGEDPNKQGIIRIVKKAHLVYKRQMPDGLYEELWIFNTGDKSSNDEFSIRREILRGTDIEPHETHSKDGIQHYGTWSVGNAQMMHVIGIPN